MRTWRYAEPALADGTGEVWRQLTDQQILEEYFQYWSERMRAVGRAEMISTERCIEDWVTIHWASQV